MLLQHTIWPADLVYNVEELLVLAVPDFKTYFRYGPKTSHTTSAKPVGELNTGLFDLHGTPSNVGRQSPILSASAQVNFHPNQVATNTQRAFMQNGKPHM